MALQVKRTKPKGKFPPPKAAAPKRGRRKQILEKAAAVEKAEKKKVAAAARRRLKAEEKKKAARLAARQAALRLALKTAALPLVIARDGVRELGKALYSGGLALGKKAPAAARLAASGAAAVRRRLNPRPAVKYLGAMTGAMTGAALVLARRFNPLPYFAMAMTATMTAAVTGIGGAATRIIQYASTVITGAHARMAAALKRAKRFALAGFSALGRWGLGLFGILFAYLQPRRLLNYSYAAAIGASLVVVGGQIALQIADDMEDRKAAEKMASYRAASDMPAETETAIAILQTPQPGKDAAAMIPASEPAMPGPVHPEQSATSTAKTKPAAQTRVQSAEVTPTAPAASGNQAASPAANYASGYPFSPAQPVIAVVIDDMGMVQGELKRFATLPAAVTFAFLPYSPNLAYQTRVIRDNGHEMIVHLPMEPKRATADPGPQALLTRLSDSELRRRIAWNLGRFEGFSGINNHMGSRFTEDPRVMRAVMNALKLRGLYFLDSMTTANSVGIPMATEIGVAQAQRDIFLDNRRDYKAILRQLRKAERIAERRGHVITIGHPYRITYQVLKDWAPTLKRKGIRLVALSRLVRRAPPQVKIAGSAATTSEPAEPVRTVAASRTAGMR